MHVSSRASTKSRALVRLIWARFSQLASVVSRASSKGASSSGACLRLQHLAALDVQLAGDLQAIEIAFAVAHDLVGAIAVLVGMGRLPVAGMDVLRLQPHGPPEGEVGLKHLAGVADRTAARVHQSRGRATAPVRSRGRDRRSRPSGRRWRGDGSRRPSTASRPAETPPAVAGWRGTRGRRGWASP